MSRTLLAALNASYSHTNLAVRSIYEYVQMPEKCFWAEWTINQPYAEILRGIYSYKPEILIFSTYIWNIELIQKLVVDVKSILPDILIGFGGPEAGYAPYFYLEKLPALDFIVFSDGELTVKEIIVCNGKNLRSIDGLFLRDETGSVVFTNPRKMPCDLNFLPFAYPEITEPDTRIYYYESSRGCPFSCSYCMSSLDKKVRFMPLERVFADIQRFMDNNVKLVKFVDRTFNLNEDRYIAIWNYILAHHNKKTMFHFEIEAEFLSDKALNFLQKVPSGVMQFEIGVQSANKETLKASGRSPNVEKIAENVKRLPKTIHQHLDLIAGLPFEDLESFSHSFDFVMELKPDALQLGFLKILHGTKMEEYCSKNGWKWMKNPPYETFSTPYLSYDEINFLKDIEIVTDAFWNSGNFSKSMNYIGRVKGWWNFFSFAVERGRCSGAFVVQRKESYWFEFLASLAKEMKDDVFYELLRFDFISAGKKGNFPDWYIHNYDKEKHRNALCQNEGMDNPKLGFAFSDYETFVFNPLSEKPEDKKGIYEILLIYPKREGNQIRKQVLL